MKEKRSLFVWLILIFLLMVLGFLSFIFFKNLKYKDEKDYVELFTQMGEKVYTDLYYDSISKSYTKEQLKEFLSKFKDIGLQFNLVEISKFSNEYKDTIETFVKNNTNCKKEETMLIIYPKEPYGKSDFTSVLQMDCYKQKKKTP